MIKSALAAMLLAASTVGVAGNEPVHIWFNLLEHSAGGKWLYIGSFETLEICQEARNEIEPRRPGNYYCLPAQVTFTKGDRNERTRDNPKAV